jgi:5-methylcytosine-specific restriction protein A
MPNAAPVHRPIGAQTETERRRAYDAKRGSPSRVYGWRWQKLRAAYLARHPLCECGCGYAATVVDHRKPHLGDDRLMYAWDNLQAMTKACHDRKTASVDGGFGNPTRRPIR